MSLASFVLGLAFGFVLGLVLGGAILFYVGRHAPTPVYHCLSGVA